MGKKPILEGVVVEYEHGFYLVECAEAEEAHHRRHFLRGWQFRRGAPRKPGSKVFLRYEATPRLGVFYAYEERPTRG